MLLNSIIIILTILVCISVGLSILLYKNNKTLEKLISSSFKRDDNVLVQLPKSIENNIDNFISRYQNFENKHHIAYPELFLILHKGSQAL